MVYAERSLSDALRLLRHERSTVTLRAVAYGIAILASIATGAFLLVLAPLVNSVYYASLINQVDAKKKPVKTVLRQSGLTIGILGLLYFGISAVIAFALATTVSPISVPSDRIPKILFYSGTTLGVGYLLALPFHFVPAIIARTQCSIPRAISKNFGLYTRHFQEIFKVLFRRFVLLALVGVSAGIGWYASGPIAAIAAGSVIGLIGFSLIGTYTIMFYLHAETTLPSS